MIISECKVCVCGVVRETQGSYRYQYRFILRILCVYLCNKCSKFGNTWNDELHCIENINEMFFFLTVPYVIL